MKEINKYIDARESDVHSAPIKDRIKWLMNLSKYHSETYCAPEAYLDRKRYSVKHPTEVIALKCMDGRIHIPYATKTPLGIVKPFRNIGGMFDLGWPYLGEVFFNTVNNAIESAHRVLVLITYHYSKGDEHRGCAGFNYDCDAAKEHVHMVKGQIEQIFGKDHQSVYPLICGLETDEDALILHGENGEELNLAELDESDDDALSNRLRDLYPDMPVRILTDLTPLVKGNIAHIKEVKSSKRDLSLDTVHREWMICVGRGFDFLHVPNIALIIGPYSPDLNSPISKAVGIIKSNMEKGMIPKDGFLILASAPYSEIGADRARAELKSHFLSQYVSNVIARDYPELVGLMNKKTAVLNWRTRNLEIID
jgi:hypothetical protein